MSFKSRSLVIQVRYREAHKKILFSQLHVKKSSTCGTLYVVGRCPQNAPFASYFLNVNIRTFPENCPLH